MPANKTCRARGRPLDDQNSSARAKSLRSSDCHADSADAVMQTGSGAWMEKSARHSMKRDSILAVTSRTDPKRAATSRVRRSCIREIDACEVLRKTVGLRLPDQNVVRRLVVPRDSTGATGKWDSVALSQTHRRAARDSPYRPPVAFWSQARDLVGTRHVDVERSDFGRRNGFECRVFRQPS